MTETTTTIHDLQLHAKKTGLLYENINPFIPSRPDQLSIGVKRKLKEISLESFDNLGVRNIQPKRDTKEASNQPLLLKDIEHEGASGPAKSQALSLVNQQEKSSAGSASMALVNPQTKIKVPTPRWHAPWELSAVISGHLGWVRSIAFDPSNEWFATGSADRTIKIWDLAKCCAGTEGGLKLTLTGHINAIRGLVVSPRHPYLFSAGEDNQVKCWDLEYNKVIRHYHGHTSGVFCLALHPTLDLLVSGGRDSVARVWDMRTKHQIHCLSGHENTVASVLTNSVDPQIITGSHDNTIRLWDLAAGRTLSTLTHHKKSIRSLVADRKTFTFCSGAADNLKKWKIRDGTFLQNLNGHNAPINAMALNDDGVLVSGGDNGSLQFWDYESGY
eukprot:gene6233-6708_t